MRIKPYGEGVGRMIYEQNRYVVYTVEAYVNVPRTRVDAFCDFSIHAMVKSNRFAIRLKKIAENVIKGSVPMTFYFKMTKFKSN